MQYIIDGYNLLFLHLTPDSNLEKNRERFISILDSQINVLNINAIVVFDGFNTENNIEKYEYFNSLEILFTCKNQTADDYILEKLEYRQTKNSINNEITVVTNDISLAIKARRLGAHTQKAKTFLKFIANKASNKKVNDEGQKKVSAEDTKYHIERLLTIFEKKLLENDFNS